MSSNGIVTTVVGWAATAPREIQGGRVAYTSFRLATTPRYFDRGRGVWAEGRTEWLTVKVFRDAALTVASSVQKGQPVGVHGRLKTEEWVGESGPRSGLVLEATALGHDLTRGRASFVRVTRRAEEPGADVGGADAGVAGVPDCPAGWTAPADAPAALDPWAVDAPADAADELAGLVAARLTGFDDERDGEQPDGAAGVDREEVLATP